MTTKRNILFLVALNALFGVAAVFAEQVVVHRAAVEPSSVPTGYTEWITEAIATAKYHGARWSNGAYLANVVTYGQYEPWYGYRRLAQHIGGDAALETYAEAAEDGWRPYSVNNSGGIPGYYHYTDGFRLDWTQNADTASRDALIDQAVSASYTIGSSAAIMKDEGKNREVAYAVLGYINSEVYCGTAHNARMEPMLELMLADVGASVNISGATTLTSGGHIEQWLGTITTDADGNITGGLHNFTVGGIDEGNAGFAPSVGGAVTAYTLIRHYELAASINGGITPDARIPAKLVRLFDAMWPYYWVAADEAMKYRYTSTSGAPALNNMMAVVYWWLYKETGDIRHLERGDALFNGTVGYDSLVARPAVTTPPLYNVKEFNELTRWTIDGLEWRAEGVALHGG